MTEPDEERIFPAGFPDDWQGRWLAIERFVNRWCVKKGEQRYRDRSQDDLEAIFWAEEFCCDQPCRPPFASGWRCWNMPRTAVFQDYAMSKC